MWLIIAGLVLLYPVYLILRRSFASLAEEFDEIEALKKSNVSLALFTVSFLVFLLPSVSLFSSKFMFTSARLFTDLNVAITVLGAALVSFEISLILLIILFFLQLGMFNIIFKDLHTSKAIKKNNIAIALLFLSVAYVSYLMLSPSLLMLSNQIYLSIS